jgi:hypothetical protein
VSPFLIEQPAGIKLDLESFGGETPGYPELEIARLTD